MPANRKYVRLAARKISQAVRDSFHDWTSEMTTPRRIVTTAGLLIQGYAMFALWTRSLMWHVTWPADRFLYPIVWIVFTLGYCVTNAMLTSEFRRKTQLEADQTAAQQIQRTLHPEQLEELPGYEMASFYQPFRAVGGDYFDVIHLPDHRTLFAVADVSGKGMAAALLAANIQALVRSIAAVNAHPLNLAIQINSHLSRYTPSDRFATAVFILLQPDSGDLIYVNAGHNAPILSSSGSTTFLQATGLPLGLFKETEYQVRTGVLPPGAALLVFTDGLADSIPEENPETRISSVLADRATRTILTLKSLVDPALSEDDITMLLVQRAGTTSSNRVPSMSS
jgi:phosphoserine phosphatase RsbU/P